MSGSGALTVLNQLLSALGTRITTFRVSSTATNSAVADLKTPQNSSGSAALLPVRVALLSLIALASSLCLAQASPPSAPNVPQNEADAALPETYPTVFPHPATWRFYVGGQLNMIFQAHPPFHAKYSGPNSFRNDGEHAVSRVASLYLGVQATRTTEFLFDVEETGGRGISDAFGLAGFTNLDVVRNPTLGAAPYIARVMLHQIIPLSEETQESDRTFLSLSTSLPKKRLEFRLGKLGMADFFDLNEVGNDSHLQFTNWTIDNNGGYVYAADTRGYSY